MNTLKKLVGATYLIGDNGPSERWADDAGKSGHGVGEAHQNTGVLRSYVQVIHAEKTNVKLSKTEH